jgi:short-subunit dehydrogenase
VHVLLLARTKEKLDEVKAEIEAEVEKHLYFHVTLMTWNQLMQFQKKF